LLAYNRTNREFSRNLRKNMTDSERILWSKLKRKQILGVQFYRQKPISKYIVDFYSSLTRLVIEIDGGQHFEPENQENDKQRDKYLESINLKVLRFSNLDIVKNLNGVLDVIYREIEKIIVNPPAPFYKGGKCKTK
jgi:very-short-patch-repair endonuclease